MYLFQDPKKILTFLATDGKILRSYFFSATELEMNGSKFAIN